jgi:hypothetical protein
MTIGTESFETSRKVVKKRLNLPVDAHFSAHLKSKVTLQLNENLDQKRLDIHGTIGV